MAGLNENGLVVRTQPELRDALRATIKEAAPDIDIDNSMEGHLAETIAEQGAERWEALSALYGAFQGRGRGLVADQYAALTGTKRRPGTHTRVVTTVNLNAGTVLEVGRVVSLDGNPDAQFRLVAEVGNDTGLTADFAAIFDCLTDGPIAAPAGKLTVIVTAVLGWNSVTNAADGTKGKNPADDVELARTRVVELAGRGVESYAAVRAAASKVTAVQSVTMYGNETSAIVSGRPAKSFETVVWDNAGDALNQEIVDAIFRAKPSGIQAYGVTTGAPTSTAVATAIAIGFTRATVQNLYVDVSAHPVAGAGAGWQDALKQALIDRAAKYLVAQKAWVSQLIQAGLDGVPAVEAIPSLTLGTAPSPLGSAYQPTYAEIVRLIAGRITVTVV